VISAACAGLGGGPARRRAAARDADAFPLQLSLSLLTGVVVGGLGSLTGAIWGAALLVLLPGWSNDIANSLSLSRTCRATCRSRSTASF
jgi:branched-chain amino acid transport system permease protein